MSYLGVTKDENLLISLGLRSFLKFWSWPNLYRDQEKRTENQDGKEICDLTIMYGNDILFFSDKRIKFNSNKPTKIAWARWYRKAIIESLKQLEGAKRWFKSYPDRIFTDKSCSKKIPIKISDSNALKFHSIVVAHGIEDFLPKEYKEKTLGVINTLSNETQLNPEKCIPFKIGSVGDNDFVHVFDDFSIKIVLLEFNTAKDFLSYLNERKKFLQSNNQITIKSETDLIQLYFRNFNEKLGKYNMSEVLNSGIKKYDFDFGGIIELYKTSQYRYKKEADLISYFWDDLIECFNHHVLNDTSEMKNWSTPDQVEPSLRYLAGNSRFERRILAEALIGLYEKVEPNYRGTRLLFNENNMENAFLFLSLPKNEKYGITEKEYRISRRTLLRDYCLCHKYINPEIRRIIGIAFKTRDNEERLSETFFDEGQDYVFIDFDIEENCRTEMLEDSYKFLKKNNLLSDLEYKPNYYKEFSE
jgi:hypothetical protein